MRLHHLTAVVAFLSCALLTASCLQSPAAPAETEPAEAQGPSDPEPIEEAQQENEREYESRDFPFVTWIEDDGEGDAGGWQRTTKTFHFGEINRLIPEYLWKCRLEIQVPLRTKRMGRVSASRAALITAEVANEAIDPLLQSRASWRGQGAVFCIELKGAMLNKFGKYEGLGARVENR